MDDAVIRSWRIPLHLYELAQEPLHVRLEPDAAERSKAAHDLGLESLPSLTADLTVRPWLDGADVTGRFEAVVEQLCSVSLDPFEQPLSGEIEVRLVPAGSPNGPAAEGGEVTYDPAAPDPPDVLPGRDIDLAAVVLEHLALEIDPFPRKPDVAFEFTPPAETESPFAALKALKDRKP